MEAKARLLDAQARKTDADAQNKDMQTLYTGLQTAQVIAQTPQTAPLGDQLVRSVGFKDKDAAPIIPTATAQAESAPIVPFPENTSPMDPAIPPGAASGAAGAMAGIETQRADGVLQNP